MFSFLSPAAKRYGGLGSLRMRPLFESLKGVVYGAGDVVGGAVNTVRKKGDPEGSSSPGTQLYFRVEQKLKSMEGAVTS